MTADGEMSSQASLVFGKYKVLERLGRGEIAEVYRALSVGAAGFQRPVILERIHPHLAADDGFVKIFVREASVAASLDHPNIVQVFDLGNHEGDLFMVLEDVPGADLGAVLGALRRQGRGLPPALAAFLAVDLCKALECAHTHRGADGDVRPVLHHALSPRSVRLSAVGAVKLADFGLARAAFAVGRAQPGLVSSISGDTMSPEQAAGVEDLDGRSDLFSLGRVLYDALAAPSDPPTVDGGEPRPLESVAPHVPAPLLRLVSSLVATDRAERPESAQAVRRALVGYLRSVTPPVDSAALGSLVRELLPTLRTERASGDREGEGSAPVGAEDLADTVVDRPDAAGEELPADDEDRDTWVDSPPDGGGTASADPAGGGAQVLVGQVVTVGGPTDGEGGER